MNSGEVKAALLRFTVQLGSMTAIKVKVKERTNTFRFRIIKTSIFIIVIFHKHLSLLFCIQNEIIIHFIIIFLISLNKWHSKIIHPNSTLTFNCLYNLACVSSGESFINTFCRFHPYTKQKMNYSWTDLFKNNYSFKKDLSDSHHE